MAETNQTNVSCMRLDCCWCRLEVESRRDGTPRGCEGKPRGRRHSKRQRNPRSGPTGAQLGKQPVGGLLLQICAELKRYFPNVKNKKNNNTQLRHDCFFPQQQKKKHVFLSCFESFECGRSKFWQVYFHYSNRTKAMTSTRHRFGRGFLSPLHPSVWGFPIILSVIFATATRSPSISVWRSQHTAAVL